MNFPLSPAYITSARHNCFWLLMQMADCALRLAAASAGKSIAARMAMMAITTSSSMRVKAGGVGFFFHLIKTSSGQLLPGMVVEHDHRPGAGFNVEFFIDGMKVGPHGGVADAQRGADFFVVKPLGEQPQRI